MAYEAEKRVILSHQQALRAVRAAVKRYADQRWRSLGSYRDDDIERFIAQVVPVVESGQVKVSQLTNAYMDSLARVAGRSVTPAVVAQTGLRGVEMAEVYRRPAVSLYTALSEGKPLDEAIELGAQRLDSLLSTDLQMANVSAASEKMRDADGVVGYNRVLNETDATCALCVIASTQMYSKDDLMPIHPGCQCSVEPVYRKNAGAAQAVNEERYAAVKEQLESQGITKTHTGTFKQGTEGNYRDLTSIKVREHGEVGPVLTWKDQDFTGPADL